jgi:hypothetical protein
MVIHSNVEAWNNGKFVGTVVLVPVKKLLNEEGIFDNRPKLQKNATNNFSLLSSVHVTYVIPCVLIPGLHIDLIM